MTKYNTKFGCTDFIKPPLSFQGAYPYWMCAFVADPRKEGHLCRQFHSVSSQFHSVSSLPLFLSISIHKYERSCLNYLMPLFIGVHYRGTLFIQFGDSVSIPFFLSTYP